MTTKEELIKLFNQSSSDKKASKKKEADDIKFFQNAVNKLFTKIIYWLKNTSLKTERNKANLNDDTTRYTKSYSIGQMSIFNDDKRMSLQPSMMYASDLIGEISIDFTGVGKSIKYSLYMKDPVSGHSEEDIWTLIDENDKTLVRQPLTEELFYSLVLKLA